MKILTRANCDALELFAAEELRRYLLKLFGVGAALQTCCESHTECGEITFIVGDLQKLDRSCLKTWKGEIPRLTDQGFIIRNTGDNRLWLCGGSPTASLWAVYELVERWGVVYSLQGDVFPSSKRDFAIPAVDEVFEPRQRLRSWRIFNEHFTGPTSWSIAQQKKFINQIVKQKYNGIYFIMWPLHPFIDYEVEGISRKKAAFGFGIPFPVTPDNIGYARLPRTDVFNNPEFIGCETFEDWHRCGVNYATSVFDHAGSFGMNITLGFLPYHIPAEFKDLLQNPVESPGLRGFAFEEGGDFFNPMHIRLLKEQFDACLDTYPQVDIIDINLPEHAVNVDQFNRAWESLDRKFGVASRYDIEKLITEQSEAGLAAGGSVRSAREARMTLIMIDSLHRLMYETGFLSRLRDMGKELSVQAGLSCPGIIPVVADALWENAHLNICPAYTASRSVRNLRVLDEVRGGDVRIDQVITLQDDNIGSLPQIATYSIDRLLEYACCNDWNGYYTRFWPIGDLDPVSLFMSKASWKKEATPEGAYREYIGALYGEKAVKPVSQALRLLEDATVILDMDHLSLLFPVKELVTSSLFKPSDMTVPESLLHIISTYKEVKHILVKLFPEIGTEEAKSHMKYMIGRMEFSINALAGFAGIYEGGKLYKENKIEEAVQAYEEMLANFGRALECMAGNVRDDSDIGNLTVYYDVLVREPQKRLNLNIKKVHSTY